MNTNLVTNFSYFCRRSNTMRGKIFDTFLGPRCFSMLLKCYSKLVCLSVNSFYRFYMSVISPSRVDFLILPQEVLLERFISNLTAKDSCWVFQKRSVFRTKHVSVCTWRGITCNVEGNVSAICRWITNQLICTLDIPIQLFYFNARTISHVPR